MTQFDVYTSSNAPDGSREILAAVEANWKFIPNLHGILAESPIALEAYSAVFTLFGKSSFTPSEQQVVFMAISYENNCEYCVSGHSALAAGAKVPAQAIQAIREGRAIADAKLQALRAFSQRLVRQRGVVDATEVDAFLAAGYTKAQVLEILVALAAKTISNYSNHVAKTPLDDFMAKTAWKHPDTRIAHAA